MIEVVVVDDERTVASSGIVALAGEPDLEVVAVAYGLEEAVIQIAAHPAAVVVCDMVLSARATGLRLLLLEPRPRIVFWTGHDNPYLCATALEHGALGYLLKTEPLTLLVRAIRRAARGEHTFSESVRRRAGEALARPSELELHLLRALARGSSVRAAAAELALTEHTVESMVRRMSMRYGTVNRVELSMLALREGWVTSPGA